MSQKFDKTRIVTFEEDYTTKAGTTVYKKGTTHAIHERTVAQIKEKGAKMKVKNFDLKRAADIARQQQEHREVAERIKQSRDN